jgi:hypothetical protein
MSMQSVSEHGKPWGRGGTKFDSDSVHEDSCGVEQSSVSGSHLVHGDLEATAYVHSVKH